MKNYLFVALLTLATVSWGQKYQFDYVGSENDELQDTPTSHFLGEEISTKMGLLKDSYTYLEYNSVSQVETPRVEKPAIYFSVKKVNKHLKKQVKKGVVEKEEAQKHLDTILTVALNIKNQSTDKLESDLEGIKDPNEIIAFFENEVEMNM